MKNIWDNYRKFDTTGFGIFSKKLEEFEIGSHISFHDLYTGCKGSGVIATFAMTGYEPAVWVTDDVTGELVMIHLGWCKLFEE